MKKGTKKSPLKITPRTKEQILRDKEVARKRKIVVEQFYPALVAATISVDEAKMLIGSITALIMEEVLSTMQERKFSDISKRVIRKLCPEGERQLEIEKLIATLEAETLFVAREIVEGMKGAIEHTILSEMQERKLDTLTPDWNIMLNK